MFVDEADIEVIAGKGGDGCVSFRREKYIPKGGPDGGDGGDGGHVYLRARENTHGLAGLTATKVYRAQSGQPGRGKQQSGAKGESITIDVPPGTLVYEVTQASGIRHQASASSDHQAGSNVRLIVDMAGQGSEPYQMVRGGKGGKGNVHFATATNQAPRQATPGTPGQRTVIKLVVSHIADVGLVGLPNVGKSTFLARVSAARPKVADYPFTTLEPHLGVVEVDGTRFVIADIPGLIEGAARGKGLGHQFLRHLNRTHVLLHLIDAQSADPLADYRAVRRELEAYEPEFLHKPEVIAVSRADTIDDKTQRRLWNQLHPELGSVIFLSSQTGRGIDDVLRALAQHVGSDLKS